MQYRLALFAQVLGMIGFLARRGGGADNRQAQGSRSIHRGSADRPGEERTKPHGRPNSQRRCLPYCSRICRHRHDEEHQQEGQQRYKRKGLPARTCRQCRAQMRHIAKNRRRLSAAASAPTSWATQ